MNPAVPPTLYVWMLAGRAPPRLIGQLHRLQNGDVSLTYCAAWIASGFALSADLPLSPNEYRPRHRRQRETAAPGALDDARPDAWGEKVIRVLYRSLYRPRGRDLLDLLYFTGDQRFGALGISASDTAYTPFHSGPLPRLEDAQRISDVAGRIEAGSALTAVQHALAAAAASLGGAKPKAVIAINGEQWVLKLFNGEPVDLPLAEHASMTLAAKAGIHAAETMPVRLASEHAVAVKRFDRMLERSVPGAVGGNTPPSVEHRLHCISAATVLRAETPEGVEPRYGYPHLARVLRRFADARTVDAQLLDLFRRMVFNILIGNTDDHEKNHALIVRISGAQPTLELAPAYDVVPTGSGATRHEFLIGEESHEPSLPDAIEGCAHFGLTPRRAALETAAVIAAVNTWQDHFRACGVSRHDIAELGAVIDRADLLQARTGFNLDDYPDTAAAAKRRARRPGNPFL